MIKALSRQLLLRPARILRHATHAVDAACPGAMRTGSAGSLVPEPAQGALLGLRVDLQLHISAIVREYTAWESEFQQQLHFRLKQPQAYLYKPEHWSYKHIVASSYLEEGGRLFKRHRSGLSSLGAPPNAH